MYLDEEASGKLVNYTYSRAQICHTAGSIFDASRSRATMRLLSVAEGQQRPSSCCEKKALLEPTHSSVSPRRPPLCRHPQPALVPVLLLLPLLSSAVGADVE